MKNKVLFLIPCSKKKTDKEVIKCNQKTVFDYLLPQSQQKLKKAREKFKDCIKSDSNLINALSRYNGHLYNVTPSFKQKLFNAIKENKLDLFIISAGFGIVHAFERIPDYDLRMDNKIAKQWIDLELPSIIEDLIIRNDFEKIFGFFSLTSGYMKVFQKICLEKLNKQGGCFFVPKGKDGSFITPRQLGKAILDMIENRLRPEETVKNVKNIEFKSPCSEY